MHAHTHTYKTQPYRLDLYLLWICRCELFVNEDTSLVPRSCVELYDVDNLPANGNINESRMFPGIRQAIDSLLNNTSSTSENHYSCVQLVRRYFCDYYYPFCDVDTGVITPMCRSTCNLLFNNRVCYNLLLDAIHMIEEQEFPPPSNASCKMTFLPLNDTRDHDVSERCIAIEG